jgi:Golgi phosphoprotein 3 GPP34
MNTGLAGTGLVADDLYLMAHHEVTGKPFVQPRPLGIGLAAALVAELMRTGSVSLTAEGAAVRRDIPPGGELARQVQRVLAGERQPFPVREWLLFIARTAERDVASRLERSGYLTRVTGRVPWRPQRLVPVDADWAFAPLVRVRSALDPARPLPTHGALLIELAVACGLGFRVDQYAPPPRRHPDDITRQVGPSLAELIAQTRAAVDGALLSHRT